MVSFQYICDGTDAKQKPHTMNALQLFALMQNQVTEIKFGQSLARNVGSFRAVFKAAVGLPRNASNKAVLQELGRVYQENGMSDKFNNYMIKFSMVEQGIELV